MTDKIRGFVTVQVKDINTHDIVNEFTVENVFTYFGTYVVFWEWNNGFNSFGNGLNQSAIELILRNSLYMNTPEIQPTQGTMYSTNGFVPSGYSAVTWNEASGSSGPYVELMNRFNPPSSNSTYNNIAIQYITTSSFADATGSQIAQVNTPVPLVQTTTQYIDIYYRVYFPNYNSVFNGNMGPNVYRQLIRGFAGQPKNFGTNLGPINVFQFSPFPTQMPYQLTDKNGNRVDTNWNWRSAAAYANFNGWRTGQAQGAPAPTWNNDYFSSQQSYSFATTDNSVGMLMNYMVGGLWAWQTGSKGNTILGIPVVDYPITKSSKIQNIFRHSSTSTSTPFLDINNMATSTGNVIPSGTWVTDSLPEMYFINVASGGPVGTATYKYTKRKILNLYQGNYNYIGSPIFNLTCDDERVWTNDTVNPTYTQMTQPVDYTYLISGSIALSSTSFALMFVDHIITHDILKGVSKIYSSYFYPTFAPTSITQIEYDGNGNIFIACRNTGLYMITLSTNTITVFGAAQSIPVGGCFGVHLGQSPSTGVSKIWAVFNGDLAYSTSASNYQTWVFYNATSTPAFNITGVSDNNWNTVSYIEVDKNTDQMLLLRLPNVTAAPTMCGVWWSPLTAATALTIPTNPTTGSNFPDFRIHHNSLRVSDHSSYWAVITYNGYYCQLFFNTNIIHALLPSVTQSTSEVGLYFINFEYDYVNNVDALITVWGLINMPAFAIGSVANRQINAFYLYANANVAVNSFEFLAPLDGTTVNGNIAYDVIGSSLVVANNITTANISPFAGGSSIQFNGSNSYVAFNAPVLSNIVVGLSYITIECWFYMTANQTNSLACLLANNPGSWTTGSFELQVRNGNTLQIAWGGSSLSGGLLPATTTVAINTWHHTAVVCTPTTVYLFLDGTLQANASLSGFPNINLNNGNFNIGGNSWDGAVSYFNGYITDVRVSPFALYTSNFTVPTAPFSKTLPTPQPLATLQDISYMNKDSNLVNSGYGNPFNVNASYGIFWPASSSPNPYPTSVGDRYGWIKLERGNYVTCQTEIPDNWTHANVDVITSVISGLTLNNTKTGGNLAIFSEYQYGWNGNSWQLGNTSPAISSTSSTLLENGISVTFQDSSTPTNSLVTGDYFNFAVSDGILKDGQSTVSYSTTTYTNPTITNNTDFGTIVGNSAVIGNLVANSYSVISAGVTINANSQVVLTGTPGDYAVMDQLFTGNFDVTIDFTKIPTGSTINGAKFGLGIGKRLLYSFAVDTNGVQYMLYRHYDQWLPWSWQLSIPNGMPLASQASPLSSVRFTRTGYGITGQTPTITMYINGVAVYSETDTQYVNGNVYQMMFRTYQYTGNPITMGTVTINSADANPPLAILGSASKNTGHYDPCMFSFDCITPMAYGTLTLNGTPVTNAYLGFSNAPNPGEISIDPSGIIRCNPADVGKTLGGSYFYIYDGAII